MGKENTHLEPLIIACQSPVLCRLDLAGSEEERRITLVPAWTPNAFVIAKKNDRIWNRNRKYSPRPAKAHGFSLSDSRAIATSTEIGS
ncbi:hypothetical protein AVEN_62410-1 [Araneus ventricosus]|uniref:Uncharacterized protein n=1 Tax=Araneus ventricosus TaxID=182803 RepID=A0A4Y2TX51_ARAVE|nr:hypothetical protein AVEN_62410-1 [Araneus ventricosus]